MFLDDVIKYKSVSVIGTAKNVGKTLCLQTILKHYINKAEDLAITSIGVDGESKDSLYDTHKPELTFYKGSIIQTSEKYYIRRQLSSNILAVSRETTAMGRLVTAKVLIEGKAILSGYSHTQGLLKFIKQAQNFGAKTCLIDGALSRKSLASPAIADATILCTGAALSKNMNTLIRQTKFQCDLIDLPLFPVKINRELFKHGLWKLDKAGNLSDLKIRTTIGIEKNADILLQDDIEYLYISGALSDSFLDFICKTYMQSKYPKLIVSDFTKIFVKAETLNLFYRKGGELYVIDKPALLAVCVNPTSPDFYKFDSKELRLRLSEVLNMEVYDLCQM